MRLYIYKYYWAHKELVKEVDLRAYITRSVDNFLILLNYNLFFLINSWSPNYILLSF